MTEVAVQPDAARCVTDVHAERVEWTKKMRLLVSPPEILDEDGTINQEWFKYVNGSSFSSLRLP